MATTICICLGDIFEGGAHLTVLPASAKGTISSSCRRWVTLFGLLTPPFDRKAALGEISEVFQFPKQSVSDHYCYAYSVFNDRSTSEALSEIGSAIGKITQEDSSIRIVQSPLLGAGAGGLSNDDAAKALIKGFLKTGHPEAIFCLFVSDTERFKKLQKHPSGFFDRLLDATEFKLKCSIYFIEAIVDLKKILK